MKMRAFAAALLLAASLPAAALAQDRPRGQEQTGRGWLGILFSFEEEDGDERVTVQDVVPGSPADRAGVRRGDEVVRLNGRAPDEDAVEDMRADLDRGDTVRLRVRRDGREEEKVVVAGERPQRMVFGERRPGQVFRFPEGGDRTIVIRMDTVEAHLDSLFERMDSLRVNLREFRGDSFVIRLDTAMRVFRDSIFRRIPPGAVARGWEEVEEMMPLAFEFGPRSIAGAEFAEMNEGLGRYFRTNDGLLVLQVAPSTPAARAGLQAGDVVTEAGGEKVESMRDLREAFARADGQEVRVRVIRQGQRRDLSIRWERSMGRVPRVRVLGRERRMERERDRERDRVRGRP